MTGFQRTPTRDSCRERWFLLELEKSCETGWQLSFDGMSAVHCQARWAVDVANQPDGPRVIEDLRRNLRWRQVEATDVNDGYGTDLTYLSILPSR